MGINTKREESLHSLPFLFFNCTFDRHLRVKIIARLKQGGFRAFWEERN